jgi:hypothetical protein
MSDLAAAEADQCLLAERGAVAHVWLAWAESRRQSLPRLNKGRLVVKLPVDRIEALIAVQAGERFDPGYGCLMKGSGNDSCIVVVDRRWATIQVEFIVARVPTAHWSHVMEDALLVAHPNTTNRLQLLPPDFEQVVEAVRAIV